MCVVDVDRILFCKVCECAVLCEVVGNNVLERCRNEEVLLAEAEELTFGVVIGRIKHLGECFCVHALLECLCVLTLCEKLHIEVVRGLRFPEAEVADSGAVAAGDHDIIRNSLHFFVIGVCDAERAVVPSFRNLATKANGEGLICSGNEPAFCTGEPDIRKLYLVAFNDLLLEKTVFVAKRETCCGVVERSKRIHEASCKTAETAIAETGVRFCFIKIVDIAAERFYSACVSLFEAKVTKIVFERRTDEEFHAHIVYALSVVFLHQTAICRAFFCQNVFHRQDHSLIDLRFGRFFRTNAKISGDFIFQNCFHVQFRDILFKLVHVRLFPFVIDSCARQDARFFIRARCRKAPCNEPRKHSKRSLLS